MDLIFLGLVAVFLIFRLFSVIGQDLGGNTDAFSEMSRDAKKQPQAKEEPKKEEVIDIEPVKIKKTGNKAINQLQKAMPELSIDNFINGASHCFKNTVENFASGNKQALEELLTSSTYKVFAKEIDARNKKGITAKDEVVAFIDIKVVDVKTTAQKIEVEVEFTTDQINALFDSENRVIEGHPGDVVRITDNWVFSRDKKSTEPNWYVKETS
ncbi:MAG: Tim44/TimA family putative adaptor protein [Alphaproteobacteria bacterium]